MQDTPIQETPTEAQVAQKSQKSQESQESRTLRPRGRDASRVTPGDAQLNKTWNRPVKLHKL